MSRSVTVRELPQEPAAAPKSGGRCPAGADEGVSPVLVDRLDPSQYIAEVRGIVPLRCELLEIVKFWHLEALESEWFDFFKLEAPERGSVKPFWTHGRERIRRIARRLGALAVEEAIAQATCEFGENQDPEQWRVFRYGTKEEVAELRVEYARRFGIAHAPEQRGRFGGHSTIE